MHLCTACNRRTINGRYDDDDDDDDDDRRIEPSNRRQNVIRTIPFFKQSTFLAVV